MSQVLAIKYRPRRFEDLIGQDTISQTLSLALDSDRLSHAYLFSGLRGSGKTSSARIFSKALNCVEGPTSQPCEVCENCVMANDGRHIDIIEMDGASNRKIDDVRDLIEQSKYKPSVGRFKIFIIDEVHMLTKEAFNALLKTLEEPPAYVKFILATTDPLKLPPTILSRTQHFRFKKIPKKDIVHHLEFILNEENIAFAPEALDILARSGSGSLRDTLTLMDQAIIFSKGTVDSNSVTDMLGLVDPAFVDRLFAAIFSKDDATIRSMLRELENYEAEMVTDELIAYLKEKMDEGDPLFNTILLDRFFRILSDAKGLLALNSDGMFVLSLVLMKMLEALKVKEIDAMIEELENEVFSTPSASPRPQTTAAASQPLSETREPVTSRPVPEVSLSAHRFDTLVQKVYERNYELGKCFDENIKLVSHEDNLLIWKSKAKGECKKKLTSVFGIIKQLVYEAYGMGTQIKNLPWIEGDESDTPAPATESPGFENSAPMSDVPESQTAESTAPTPEESTPPESEYEKANPAIPDSPTPQAPQPDTSPTPEFDSKAILEEPMVQKAKELFNPKKIIVENKI